MTEVNLLKATTETQMWLNELNELEDDYASYIKERAKLDETNSTKKKKKGKAKLKVKSKSKKGSKLKLKK